MCKSQISNVHVYWRLDYQAVYRVVTDELADLDKFARQVQRYLVESEGRAQPLDEHGECKRTRVVAPAGGGSA